MPSKAGFAFIIALSLCMTAVVEKTSPIVLVVRWLILLQAVLNTLWCSLKAAAFSFKCTYRDYWREKLEDTRELCSLNYSSRR